MLREESKLLATHWDAVEDVLAARGKLQEDLTAFLKSLKQDLMQMDWWTPQWHFIETDPVQIYIAHSKWKNGKDYALWIGIEQFIPEVLFGKRSVSQLYLWAQCDKSLAAELREMIELKRIPLPNEFGKGLYILTRFVPKCLPKDVEHFEKFMKEPILKFFSECAEQEKAITPVVFRYFKK